MDLKNSENFARHASTYKEDFLPDEQAGLARLHARMANTTPAAPAVVRPLPARRWLAYAATLLLILTVGFFLLQNDGVTAIANDTDGPLAIALPDGTEVLLQEGTTLNYSDHFNENDRRVSLNGQAYFEVHKDAERPFLVDNGTTELRVTGTAFNLRINDQELEVEVSEGSVELNHGGEIIPVAAHQCGLALAGKKCALMPAKNLNRHAWRTGTLRFDSIPLPAALKTIANNYGFKLTASQKCTFPVSGTFPAGDPVAVLRTIAEMGGGSLLLDADASYRLTGMACE